MTSDVAQAFRPAAIAALQTSTSRNTTLTAVDGIKVGSVTLPGGTTGCTVILVDGEGVPGGVSQRGGAPGTRETDLLNPLNMVDKVNAVVLSGGSAFGLDAATGTVKWLEEHHIGWDVRIAKVPIVPGAILFDLPVGNNATNHPGPDCGYKAVAAATHGAGVDGYGRRRRGRDRRQDGRTRHVDERRPRQRRAAHAQRPDRRGDRRGQCRRRHHRSRHRQSGRRRAQPDGTFADARALLRSGALMQRAAPRRVRPRTRPSASSPPTPS